MSETLPQISNHDRQPTTLENRNLNTKYIHIRNKWRADYAIVCECIQYFKSDVKKIPTRHGMLMLRSMQETARTMMEKRNHIGEVLRVTAYPYV
jgi:hypothetical protein